MKVPVTKSKLCPPFPILKAQSVLPDVAPTSRASSKIFKMEDGIWLTSLTVILKREPRCLKTTAAFGLVVSIPGAEK